MENSQPLATESFSYSWLIDRPPSPTPNLRRIDDDDNFHFDVPQSIDFVNADEIFSQGQIMPVYADRSSRSIPASPLSASDTNPHYLLAKWKRILSKCLGFVHRRVGCSRKSSSRVDDLQRKVLEASPRHSSSAVELGDFDYYCLKIDKNWRSSPTSTSPCLSTSYAASCDADDNSIREAILYCKRSIEK